MPDSCCAVYCTNRREGRNKHLPFYSIPSKRTAIGRRRRKEWMQALRRDDWRTWSEEKISKQKVCGEHFISGDYQLIYSFCVLPQTSACEFIV